jgi:acyl-CoA synthetase (NDP forming)/GNAT superfamily N-acetyltransferase
VVAPLDPGHHVVLRDGSTAYIRPVRPDDEPLLLALFESLSPESRIFRFFGPAVDLAAAARRESRLDDRHDLGLLATAGTPPRAIGHAYGALVQPERAEAAVEVADDYQGRGLGTILLGQLAALAAARGIQVFEAVVMSSNYRMIGVFRELGFPLAVHTTFGQIKVEFPTSLTPETLDRFDRREQIAAASAVQALLDPQSVAVVGASRRATSMGGAVLRNLLAQRFGGPIYAVNPAAHTVEGLTAYPSVAAIEAPIDLAIVAVPAPVVVQVAEQCAAKGVRALIVFAAGFAEASEAGRARQADLVRVCRAAGMRLLGPNSIGLLNTAPGVRLHALVGTPMPAAGGIAFASQSGTLGQAALAHARLRQLGISSFVATGNKADISTNDLLNYWESDPATDVIMLYVESFGNPRKFSRIARRVATRKPIVVMKAGRSAAAPSAGASATAIALAGSDLAFDGLFRQAGVIRTNTVGDLLDVAAMLALQPLPAGRQVGIIGNVHGPAVLCMDACRAGGLELATLAADTEARLRPLLERELAPPNPATLRPWADAADYRAGLEAMLADPDVQAVIAIHVPPFTGQPAEIAAAIGQTSAAGTSVGRGGSWRKPLLAVFMGAESIPPVLPGPRGGVPVYPFPEAAAGALARVSRYAAWRRRPVDPPVTPAGLRRDEAAALVADALGRGAAWLPPVEVEALLGHYGVRMHAVADGGSGVPLVVSVVHDAYFGPVLACVGGGPLGLLAGDVVFRLPPLNRGEAAGMLRELKTYPLLEGYGGGPACDVAALEDLIQRLGLLVEDLPQVAELECRPVRVGEHGVRIESARVRLAVAEPERPVGAR